VGLADLVTPVTTTDGDNGELGGDDGATDGGGDFLGALDSEANVTVVVADSDERLEARALTGTGLLLNGHDLQHLVLQSSAQQKIDDLELLDGKGVEVDLLKGLDLAILDKAAKLGDGDPFLVAILTTAAATTTASTTATSTASTAATTSLASFGAASASTAESAAATAAITPKFGPEAGHFFGSLFFGIAFIFIVVGRSELFTENFFVPLTAVRRGKLAKFKLVELWTISPILNIAGGTVLILVVSTLESRWATKRPGMAPTTSAQMTTARMTTQNRARSAVSSASGLPARRSPS